MGVARGDPPSREHKATHNSSTIEDKNPGNKKRKEKNGGGWVHARKLHTSCAGRGHGREVRKNKTEKAFSGPNRERTAASRFYLELLQLR